MKIILSPAKKMVRDEEFMAPAALPRFLPETQRLYEALKSMSYGQLKQVWKCSDALTEENRVRLQNMDLYSHLTPALLSYEGIAYQYMAPNVFSDQELAYVNEHLRILSGFYGILRPMDGITPYRLEMGAKLRVGPHRDLYQYWGSKLADSLCAETDLIINLASKEYSKVIAPHLPETVRMITCSFVQLKAGKLVEQSTACKMARGDMVRYLAENQITEPDRIKNYHNLYYRYLPEKSGDDLFVFLKEEP